MNGRFLVSTVLVVACLGCGESASPAPATGGAGGGGAAGSGGGGSTAVAGGGAGGAGNQGGAASRSGGGGGEVAGGSAGSSGAGGVAPAGLVITPSELVFGAVQQTQTEAQVVTLENTGSAPLTIAAVELDDAAAGSDAFELVMPPAANLELVGGAKQELEVRFNPSAIQLFEGGVLIDAGNPELNGRVALFGLGTKGLEGENEPFLKIVLTTLGYDVDVGGNGLLSTTTPLVGSEVSAQRFEASGAEPVELVPVARYSPEEPIPYGFYTANAETTVGTISSDQFQELNPGVDAGSEATFVAPAGPFGLYTVSETHSTYTEDSKNAGNQVQHAVRTYPLKDREGAAIANAYLVCFEEAANGDYQDYVFTIRNVKPAP